MSFKGIVTRKEKETGVDLLAKIVTENKKKSTKQKYKVRVASNGLSDTESCSRAVILKKEEISKAGPGGSEDLTVNVNLNALGAFGTTLTYKITNDDAENPLTDYLSLNGTLHGNPQFGAGDVSGKLYITASKGDASITAIVPIVVRACTAESILSNESFVSKSLFWKAITTSQPEFTLTNNKINFVAQWEPWKFTNPKPSNQPITVTYTVNDMLAAATGQHRISDTTPGLKTVLAPSYSTLMSVRNYSPNFTVEEYRDSANVGRTTRNLKCNGLIVTATLSLGEEAQVVYEYNITTCGEALTNKEIIDAIESLAGTPTPRGNVPSSVFKLYQSNNLSAEIGSYFMNATAPTSRDGDECYNINAAALNGTEFNIKCITSSDFEAIVTLPSLGFTNGRDFEITITPPEVFAFNGTDIYLDDAETSSGIFNQEGINLAENVISVNIGAIKNIIDGGANAQEATGFAVFQKIVCSKYEGTPKELKLMKWFYITNIDAVDAT